MNRARILIAVAIAVLFGAGGYWLAAARAPHQHQLEPRETAEGKAYYTCAMHPEVRQDEPGNCPICGMELVRRDTAPAAASREDSAGGTVIEVDPRMAQNLGIRTAPATVGAIAHGVDVVGAVEVDERLIYAVESRAEGWVEQLRVRAVGEPVKQGQRVAGVYSPELYSAQEELVLAARSGDASLIAASRQRLLLLGLSDGQIAEVQRSGKAQRAVLIAAPRNGVVIELNVREGQKVMPGMPIMRIADLSRVWVTVDVPESLAAAVAQGRRAEARLTAVPGKVFEGRVDYVYPNLDAATRTVRARIVFENRAAQLKPGMYANVAVLGAAGARPTLTVPTEAVIRTGKRNVVIVQESEGRFRPAEVTLGPEHEGRIAILAGLEEGQQVVTSGQFLLDSEASLRGAYQRLEGPAAPAPAHQHGEQP
jgi:Cu(I)/Ag(I) efflux system membrane fusion protein